MALGCDLCLSLVGWPWDCPKAGAVFVPLSLAEGVGDIQELPRKHLLSDTELRWGGRLVAILHAGSLRILPQWGLPGGPAPILWTPGRVCVACVCVVMSVCGQGSD